MKQRPPRSTRTDTPFPDPTLFLSAIEADHAPREFLQPKCGAAERRLARTAGADERDDLAAAHRDIDAVDHAFGRARAEQSRLAAIFDHRLLDRQQHLADAAARAAVAWPRQRAHALPRIGMPRRRDHVALPPRPAQPALLLPPHPARRIGAEAQG